VTFGVSGARSARKRTELGLMTTHGSNVHSGIVSADAHVVQRIRAPHAPGKKRKGTTADGEVDHGRSHGELVALKFGLLETCQADVGLMNPW